MSLLFVFFVGYILSFLDFTYLIYYTCVYVLCFLSFTQFCCVDIYSNIFAPFQSPAPEFNYFEIIITYIYLYIYLNSSRFLCSLTYVAVERNDIFEKPRPNQDRSYFEKSLKYNRLPFSSYNEHIIT